MNQQYDLMSPNLLVSVMDKIDTPMVLINIAGCVTYANAAILKRLSPDGADYQGRVFTDISDGVQTGAFQRSHCVITATPNPMHGTVQPLFDAAGTLIGQLFVAVPPFMQTWSNLDELQNREMRWETAMETGGQAVWDTWDTAGDFYVSQTWYDIRRIDADRYPIQDHNWTDHIHPSDLPHVLSELERQTAGETDDVNYQYRCRYDDGDWIWIQSRGRVVTRDRDGVPERTIGTDTNITAFKQIEAGYEALTERLKLAMEVSEIGLWHFQLEKGQVHWDDQMLAIYGIEDEQHMRPQAEWLDTIYPDDREPMMAYSENCLRQKSDFSKDYRILRPSGEVRHVRSRARYLENHDHSGPSFLGVNIDITDDIAKTNALEKARAAMEFESRHDPLTGLANRRKLDEVHSQIIAQAAHNAATPDFAVLHIDLDRFKEINDTHGHAAGDAVLVHVAHLIKRIVADAGLVARVGGDEFVVLIDGQSPAGWLDDLAQKLITATRMPYNFEGEQLCFGMSIGIALHDPDQQSQTATFVAADLALYQAKQDGRNCARHFEPRMREAETLRRLSNRDIERALRNGEFTTRYQPQFCAKTRQIVGAETLVRWDSPDHGLLTPDKFLPAATANGLIARIDDFVMQQALADLKQLDEMGLDLPRISVNISGARLHDPALKDKIHTLHIPAGRLSIELLETTFLDVNEPVLMANLDMLRDRGVALEIDDFGSGHASILGFLRIAPERLKIDRDLIAPIDTSKGQRKIVAAVVEIAKLSKAEVIAEGIETATHARIATAIGCDILQGYGLARPMDKAALITLLSD